MTSESPPVDRLLVLSPGAGGLTDEMAKRLTDALDGFVRVDLTSDLDVRALMAPAGTVVVAGGDGTVGFVARQLAGSHIRLGIIPVGTFDNFAHGLGIPEELEAAIDVVRTGTPRPVTLGTVGDRAFLEVASMGFFGKTIEFGEALKDRSVTAIGDKVGGVIGAKRFRYTLTGDIDARGRALSLVFTNTPTTGARMAVGESDPTDPRLELSVRVGASRFDVVRRVLAAAVFHKRSEPGMTIRFSSLTATTEPPISVYADNEEIGTTPVTVRALPGALTVLLPS